MFKFSKKSLQRLNECDHRLIGVAVDAIKISPYDFGITCGVRTKEEQKQLVKDGKSQTLNSRHLPNEEGLSEAFDFAVYVNGEITWDERYYRPVMQAMVTSAIKNGVPVRLGGLWRSFKDCPHVELDL